jgi:cell division septum initiation protein DivIVA
MSEDPLVMAISSSTSLNPDEIARRTFPTVRKGVDGEAVRRYLESIGDEIRTLVEREAQLRRRLYEAERRAAEPPVLDEATLNRAVGAETARVLQTAHDAARDVIARAEAQAAELVAEAETQASHRAAAVQDEAAGLLEVAAEEAAALAASALAEATALQESTQAEAEALLGAAQEDAVALLDTTNQRCRDAVREAQQLRKSVLSDLLARRRALFVQLEQLRSGRDSLVEVVDAVGGAVEELRGRLERAEHGARVAAADAGERAEALVDDMVDTLLDPEIALELRNGLVGVEIDADVVVVLESGVEADELAAGDGAGTEADEAAEVAEVAAEDEAVAEAAVAAEDEAEAGFLSFDDLDDGEAREQADTGSSHRSVGELFARIRASRGSEARARSATADVADVEELAAASELALAGEGAGIQEAAGDEVGTAAGDGLGTAATGGDDELGPAGTGGDEVGTADAGGDGVGTADAGGDGVGTAGAGGDGVGTADAGGDEVGTADAGGDGVAGIDEAAIERSDESGDADAADGAAEPEADVAASVVEDTSDAAVISKRDALVAPVVTRLARALKRALQDDQNELLNAIRHASGAADLDALLPEEIQRDRYAQAASGALADGWLVGRSWLAAEGVAGEDDEAVGTLATDTGRLLGTELAGDLSGLLRHRLTESLRVLGDVAEGIQDAAGAAYREWKGARVEGIAGDFALRAFFGGAVAAGEGTIVRWVVNDGRPCPDCDDNALAAEQLAGDEWPTGQLHPPVHPGCRCLLVAITD